MTINYIESQSVLIIVNNEKLEKKKFRGTLYLDRDGVIIEDFGYVGDKTKVRLIPSAKKFMTIARSSGYLIAVITNQSGVGRGYYTWNDYIEVTNKMNLMLGKEATPDIIIACGVRPNSECGGERFRKPNTGMIDYIRNNFAKVENNFEILIGDKLSDIQCGLKANIKINIHVHTGHGSKERDYVKKEMNSGSDNFIKLAEDLSEIIELIS